MTDKVNSIENEILSGESGTLEYKEKVPSSHLRFLKTVVAFANGNGGRIVFGINDVTHSIAGMNEENIFKDADSISDAIYNSIEPAVSSEVTVQTVKGKALIVVEIYPGSHSPYYIKSLGLEQGCFVRNSATTRLADKETIRELIFEGSNKSYDLAPQVKRTITEKEIKKFCKSLKESALKNCPTEEERKRIKPVSRNMLLAWQMIQERKGKYIPSNAFDLLSENTIWSAKIQCTVFKGQNRDVFVDRREYAGSVQSEIEEAYEFVLRNIRLSAQIKGLYRRDLYEIPVAVVRELIVNAVVHRTIVA